MQKNCVVCGEVFMGRRNKIYCSQSCKQLQRVNNSASSIRKYNAAYHAANKEKISDRKKRLRESRKVAVTCLICPTTFRSSDPRKVFCSKACSNKYHRQNNIEIIRQRDNTRRAASRDVFRERDRYYARQKAIRTNTLIALNEGMEHEPIQ